jgi:two-component system cell cycle sensor histidine kinase/response regulator CckA
LAESFEEGTMPNALRVLIVEDDLYDVELEISALEQAGFNPTYDWVATREDFISRLDASDYDLVLADYTLPAFDGLAALKLFLERGLDIPFIFVSGTFGEEAAIESLKAGATDCVLKQHLSRLGPVVVRALREKREQRQRRRSERALRASEERLRFALKGASMGAWDWSVETGRLIWSEGLDVLYGFIPYDLETLLENVHVEDREFLLGEAERITATGGNHEATFRILMPDGTVRWIHSKGQAIWDEAGRLVRMIGISRDVTEMKLAEAERGRLEEQLRESQKMDSIGRLAGGIAHDFNNLLTAIIGYSQLLQSRFSQDERARHEIEEIQKAGQRAAELTGHLLAFSRKQVLQPRVLDLNQVVSRLDKMLRRLIGEDIEMTTALDPSLGQIKADPGQIEQVIMNLVVNARDSMPRGGKLVISTSNASLTEEAAQDQLDLVAGDYATLTISDTGEGMDAEVMSHIFEPFFSTKERSKGIGLGLSIIYGIVKQSGGHIFVTSKPRRGTTFNVYLPRADERADVVEAGPASAAQLRGTETVLLVEDEETVRKLVRNVLQASGYTIIEAANGRQALEICRSHEGTIHLAITDVVMPQMSGRELIERLAPQRPRMKVLYISGYTDDAIVEHGILDSATHFLQKPFTPAALTRKVREVLDG